jgi:hypothetical protein
MPTGLDRSGGRGKMDFANRMAQQMRIFRRLRPNGIGNAAILTLSLILLTGCASTGADHWALHPAAETPKEQATPEYWYAKPPVKAVASFDFQKLWDACEVTARRYQFTLDRVDYRQGILTTRPLVSEQIFEPWKRDVGTFHELLQSTTQTIRRTVRFEVVRSEGGVYIARPKVLVEKLSQFEHRVTAVSEYRNFFSAPVSESARDELPSLPTHYWYAVGRDDAFEIRLADAVKDQLQP